MNVVLSIDAEWLLSKEEFPLYASCMYHPMHEKYKRLMKGLWFDQSVRVYVCRNQGKKTGMMALKCSDSAAEIIGIAVPEKLRHRGKEGI